MAADGTSRAPSRWLVTDARRRSTLLYLARRLANSTRRDNGKRMIQTTTLPYPPCQAARSRTQKLRSTVLGRRPARRRTRRRSSAAGIAVSPPRRPGACQPPPALPRSLSCGLGSDRPIGPLLRHRDQPVRGFQVRP
jgi:hypothetical protein